MTKTVHVTCGPATGATLRLYRKPVGDMPAMPDPDHDPVVLRAGANPGIDAEFFAAWIEQNKQLAESLGISGADEHDPEESAKREEE